MADHGGPGCSAQVRLPRGAGSGAHGSVRNTSMLESFLFGQRKEADRPATASKGTGKSGLKSQEL